jgi:hypothetical protein
VSEVAAISSIRRVKNTPKTIFNIRLTPGFAITDMEIKRAGMVSMTVAISKFKGLSKMLFPLSRPSTLWGTYNSK